jgi:hypothetical protein
MLPHRIDAEIADDLDSVQRVLVAYGMPQNVLNVAALTREDA